jgi:hypothetical protein
MQKNSNNGKKLPFHSDLFPKLLIIICCYLVFLWIIIAFNIFIFSNLA